MTTELPRDRDGDGRAARADPVAAPARLLQFPQRAFARVGPAASIAPAEAELLGEYNLHNG